MTDFDLARKFTTAQIKNIVAKWEESNQKAFKNYQALVRLGDSEELAVASTINQMTRASGSFYYKSAYEA